MVSQLTARPARDPLIAAHQHTTKQWWQKRRKDFAIYVSRLVWEEASVGHPDAVRKRQKILRSLPWLQFKKEVSDLADVFLDGLLPATATADATHIALSAVHGMEFLLTWNCTHINNAEMANPIREICKDQGYSCPVICTPEELQGI